MELWFIYAVISTIGIGLSVYTHKIAAYRKYNSAAINFFGAGGSAFLLIISVFFTTGWQPLSWGMLLLALVAGVVYIIGANLRLDALRYADATIVLPVHKVLSPLLVVVFGFIFLGEFFTTLEWIGIVLSLLTPLLLISRLENKRQSNLLKGLLLIFFSSVTAATVAYLNKIGVDLFPSALMFGAVANSIGAVFAFQQYYFRKVSEDVLELPLLNKGFLCLALLGALFQFAGFTAFLLAFAEGGPLGIVYTINSLYILIPIILSVLFYNEHCNARKVVVIILSVVALWFLQ